MKNTFNNQDGMTTLVTVMVTSMAIVILMSTFYIYTVNQSKYHARIREAYQMINVMESFAAASRKAYDAAATVQSLNAQGMACLLYTSPSPRDDISSRMPSSA